MNMSSLAQTHLSWSVVQTSYPKVSKCRKEYILMKTLKLFGKISIFSLVPETYEYSDVNIAYKFSVNRVIQLEYIK